MPSLTERASHRRFELDSFLAGIERELIERALRQAKGNKTRAAELLGVNRARLLRRLAQLGLGPPVAEDEAVVFEPVLGEPATKEPAERPG